LLAFMFSPVAQALPAHVAPGQSLAGSPVRRMRRTLNQPNW
jgi:hypothetical protein